MELEDSIKLYLENKMTESERIAFEQKMDMDEQLSEEVAFQKEMFSFFEQRDEINALRSILQEAESAFFNEEVVKKPTKKKVNTLVWIFPLGLLLIAVSYFIYSNIAQNSNNEKTRVSEEQLETNKIIDDTTSQKIEIPTDENEETTDEEEAKDELPDLENQPIADAGSYNLNPALEAILSTSFRDNQSVELTSPAKGQTFKLKGRKVLFSLDGKTNKSDKLKLVLYDNNPRSFDGGFKTLELSLTPSEIGEEEYSISTKANIPLKKGLYYYLITNSVTNNLVYAGKFEVK